MYVRAKLSEEKLSEHGATLRMRRTVRRTHEPNRDKRTERFGCFFMYRATPSVYISRVIWFPRKRGRDGRVHSLKRNLL